MQYDFVNIVQLVLHIKRQKVLSTYPIASTYFEMTFLLLSVSHKFSPESGSTRWDTNVLWNKMVQNVVAVIVDAKKKLDSLTLSLL